MFGAIMLGVITCGCVAQALKEASYDGNHRSKAGSNNQKYYMDFHGSDRRVDNNNKVMKYTIDFKTGDRVDLDLKTGEVLRNYSQEKRNKDKRKELEFNEKNKNEREKAIKEGKYFYSSYEKTEYRMMMTPNTPYEYVKRRCIDNLLLHKDSDYRQVRDAKYGFLLYRDPKEYNQTYRYDPLTVEKDKEWNLMHCRCKFIQEEHNMTYEELKAEAERLGAII